MASRNKKSSKREKNTEDIMDPIEPNISVEKEALDISIVKEEIPERVPTPIYEEPLLTDLIIEWYEGDKSKGLFHGDGVAYFRCGHVYKGQFYYGLMYGKGVYTWSDGVSYEGDLKNNQITGMGQYKWLDGSVYDGEVLNGLRHGEGVFQCKSLPFSYSGQWHCGKRHGTGKMNYDTDGYSFYEGDWLNNKRHGYGVRRYKSGNIYEGDWENNNRHGQGMMRWIDTYQTYCGQWENGIQHGHGEHTWYLKRVPGSQYPLRNQYIGQFHLGNRQGYGVFHYADGSRYEGNWENNIKQGRGKYIFKNGQIFEGMFIQDHMAERIAEDGGFNSSFNATTYHLIIDSVIKNFDNVQVDEFQQVENVIVRHMSELKKVYDFYSGLGHDLSPDNTFMMTRLQFWRFLKDCKFHHYEYSLSDMDRILAFTESADSIHSPTQRLLMWEFLKNLIILSYHFFNEEFSKSTPEDQGIFAKCLSKAITEHILKHSFNVQGHFLYDPKRASNALGYVDKCWEVYQSICKPRKLYPHELSMTARDFLLILKDFNLINDRLTPKCILEILAADNPAVYDGTDCNLELDMTFLEFFEGTIGCSMVFVTEEVLKDPNVSRPSTVTSHLSAGTLPLTSANPNASRVSQPLEDNFEDAALLAQDSSQQQQIISPETGSPGNGPRVLSTSEGTNKNLVDGITKLSEQAPQGPTSAHTVHSLHLATSKEFLDDVATSKSQTDQNSLVVKQVKSSQSLKSAGSDLPQPLLQSMLSMGGTTEIDDGEVDEIDEEEREFNFWTHQIHIFFVVKLFPAFHQMELVKAKIEQERINKQPQKDPQKQTLVESQLNYKSSPERSSMISKNSSIS